MPYKDPEKQRKAMKKIKARYYKRKKAESAKEREERLRVRSEHLLTAAVGRSLTFRKYTHALKEALAALIGLQMSVHRFEEGKLDELCAPLADKVIEICPWMKRERIVVEYELWELNRLHPYQLAIEARDGYAQFVLFKLETVERDLDEAASTILSKFGPRPVVEQLFELGDVGRIESYVQCMKALYDLGHPFYASDEVCRRRFILHENFKLPQGAAFLKKWVKDESDLTAEVARLRGLQDKHYRDMMNEQKEAKRFISSSIHAGIPKEEIERALYVFGKGAAMDYMNRFYEPLRREISKLKVKIKRGSKRERKKPIKIKVR